MAEISASMVMELRQRTGLGMMECKKALAESAGDLAKAEDLLRIKSGAKASKAAGRVAAEGVVGAYLAHDGKLAAMGRRLWRAGRRCALRLAAANAGGANRFGERPGCADHCGLDCLCAVDHGHFRHR